MRIGKLEVSRDEQLRRIWVTKFRKPGPNFVHSIPYGRPQPYPNYHVIKVNKMVYEEEDNKQVPERHQALIEHVVDLYCQWLNGFNDNRDPEWDYTYTPGTFLDTAVNEYANTVVQFAREVDGRLYMELRPYDGDDGGPATLYIHAQRDWEWSEGPGKGKVVHKDTYGIDLLVQEFDTYFTPFFNGTIEGGGLEWKEATK